MQSAPAIAPSVLRARLVSAKPNSTDSTIVDMIFTVPDRGTITDAELVQLGYQRICITDKDGVVVEYNEKAKVFTLTLHLDCTALTDAQITSLKQRTYNGLQEDLATFAGSTHSPEHEFNPIAAVPKPRSTLRRHHGRGNAPNPPRMAQRA